MRLLFHTLRHVHTRARLHTSIWRRVINVGIALAASAAWRRGRPCLLIPAHACAHGSHFAAALAHCSVTGCRAPAARHRYHLRAEDVEGWRGRGGGQKIRREGEYAQGEGEGWREGGEIKEERENVRGTISETEVEKGKEKRTDSYESPPPCPPLIVPVARLSGISSAARILCNTLVIEDKRSFIFPSVLCH